MDDATEGDWQTVTTEQALGPPRSFGETLAKGTGSSLADVSDASEYNLYQCEFGSTERIIQHPLRHDESGGSYHVRTDKQTNRPVLLSRLRDQETRGFMQNSSRKMPQQPSRAAAAIRRFSNTFRRDHSNDQSSWRHSVIEMRTLSHSYGSLSSESEADQKAKPGKGSKFRWSRIQQNLGREPPKTPLTVFDQPLYRSSLRETTHSKNLSHVPHDEFLNEIPRLPFPLISLPEAAMLQHFRRERGEEDHTERGHSFTSKARSGTVSTVSSQCPRTPLSSYFDTPASAPHEVATPAAAHQPFRISQARRQSIGKCSRR